MSDGKRGSSTENWNTIILNTIPFSVQHDAVWRRRTWVQAVAIAMKKPGFDHPAKRVSLCEQHSMTRSIHYFDLVDGNYIVSSNPHNTTTHVYSVFTPTVVLLHSKPDQASKEAVVRQNTQSAKTRKPEASKEKQAVFARPRHRASKKAEHTKHF